MDELDYSALAALNLPEIKVSNDGTPKVIKQSEEVKQPKVVKENTDNKKDVFQSNEILEVESIDDLDNVIDTSELLKNQSLKNEFGTEIEIEEDEDSEENPYSAYGKWLKEKSILNFDEEEFNKAEDKDDFLIKKETEKYEQAINEYKESQSPYIKQLMDMEDDGIDIGKVLRHDAIIQSYDKLSLEKIKGDENIQKKIVVDYLTRQGNSEEEIQEEIQEMEDNLTLDKKAEKWFPKLREFEIKEKDRYIKESLSQQKKAEKEYEDQLKSTKSYIDKLDSLLPNVPLTKEDKNKIFDNMTKADRNGQTALMKAANQDPIKFNAMITYLATIKNFDFTDLVNATKTATTRDIKKTLTNSPDNNKKTNTTVNLNAFKRALKK